MKKEKGKGKKERKGSILFSFISCPLSSRQGQSLFEIIIGLAVGVVLISAGTFAISVVLRSHVTLQKSQSASAFAQEFIATLPALARADWNSLAGLSHGSSSPYFLVASSTSLIPVPGEEGILDNDVTDGLAARWGFDESLGTLAYDMTGADAPGAFVGAPVHATSSCLVGGCVVLGGASDWVNIPDRSFAGDFTIAAWAKLAGAISDQDAIFGQEGGGQDVNFSGGRLRLSAPGDGVVANTTAALNAWTHYTITRSGSGLTLYYNGIQDATGVWSGAFTPKAVGRGNTGFLEGSLDDIRVYGRALSATEVQRLYASNRFTRSFYLKTSCRTTNASSAIAGIEPCAGGTAADPSTLAATVQVSWPVGATRGSAAAHTYLIRGGNETFRQTDWSGGAGESGPIVSPGSRFASSTNVDVTGGGSLRIHGL